MSNQEDNTQDENKNDTAGSIPRRALIKAAGATSAVLGLTGLGLSGYQAGKNPDTNTGCEGFQGTAQSFDRQKYSVDKPHYQKVGPTSRPDGRTEVIFSRLGAARTDKKIEELKEPYRSYYLANPEDYELDKKNKELRAIVSQDSQENKNRFLLAEAWAGAMGAVVPETVGKRAKKNISENPPEVSDFPRGKFEPYKMKNPEATAKLIKKVSYEFGTVLVGITKLNPDWVYKYPSSRRGFDRDKPIEVPKHWQYAIVVGTPMSWDPMYANPNYGTSNDAYSRSRIVAFRLASFIKKLGYAARPHTPGNSYDLMVPPIMVDAGLGEQGRHSIVITPELGCNFRPAVVTTNLPMKIDKPISFGVQEFCKNCKICAEQCPSGAISTGGKGLVRNAGRIVGGYF